MVCFEIISVIKLNLYHSIKINIVPGSVTAID